jgi:dephospho-CoA kinase
VVERWGADVAPDGTVDRTAVALHVFASENDRRWLERLLWPRVGARVTAWRQELEALDPRPRAAVVEVPLLFESRIAHAFDATIAVVAEESLRAQRAGGRAHAAVDERAARQLSQQEKAQRATYTVDNDGSVGDLERKLSAVLENLSR